MDPPLLSAENEPADAAKPRQLGIIDLFALVTLAAILSALAAPHVRLMEPKHRQRLLIVVSIQVLFAVGGFLFAMLLRKRLLARSGRFIGIAYCGEMQWRHWPMVKSIAFMLLIAAVSLSLTITISALPELERAIGFPLYQFPLAEMAGSAFARLLWRVYPNALEFFQNGIGLGGVSFVPWAQVDLRPSKLFPDRIALVIRLSADSPAGDTRLAQVSASLRKRIAEVANRSA